MKRLDSSTKLYFIKLIHTMIWGVLAVAILYILIAGIFDRVNTLVWVCIGLVFIECIVLLIYKWKCPLTLLGHRYTDKHDIGFDIFLPKWLAKYNKVIFSSLFVLGFTLVLWRV